MSRTVTSKKDLEKSVKQAVADGYNPNDESKATEDHDEYLGNSGDGLTHEQNLSVSDLAKLDPPDLGQLAADRKLLEEATPYDGFTPFITYNDNGAQVAYRLTGEPKQKRTRKPTPEKLVQYTAYLRKDTVEEVEALGPYWLREAIQIALTEQDCYNIINSCVATRTQEAAIKLGYSIDSAKSDVQKSIWKAACWSVVFTIVALTAILATVAYFVPGSSFTVVAH